MSDPSSTALYTIGHSTHPIETFLALLRAHAVETLVDVRSFPGSRRHPQFNQRPLAAAIRAAGLAYIHMASLGGRRKNHEAYAKTAEFRAALADLERLGRESRVAIMCAESLWWQCHRRIIADDLVKDGFAVTHIMPPKQAAALVRSPELPGL
jgi:uncharacterized protein (DUF488 family)